MYQLDVQNLQSSVTTPQWPFTCRHSEFRLVLFTLQTWVQLLPEDMCESWEMEMDPAEAQTLPMNGTF